MKKIQKTSFLYLIILIQSILAVAAGIVVLGLFSGDKLPAGMVAGRVSIGGMGRQEAVSRIKQEYESILKDGKLSLSIKEGKNYNISYTDFDVTVDANATVGFIPAGGANRILSAFKDTFTPRAASLKPVIVFDESKLRKILIRLSGEIDREPVDAVLSYEGGKIVKKSEQDGQQLDIADAVERIRRHISGDPTAVLEFSRYDNTGIVTLQPARKLRDLEEIDTIVSEYSTPLLYPELYNAIKLAAEAMNGVVLEPSSTQSSNNAAFSFVQWLKSRNASFENDNEGYDQVASTLYAALLGAGIDRKAITRMAHQIPVDYIEPGLDAWISGNGGELKFSNTLPHKIALLADVREGRLIIGIAGNSADKREDLALKTEVVERIAPPVLNIENKALKKGEKIVLDPGREGLKINVYRGTELISEDKYDAVKKVVQIGPDTEWTETGDDK